MTNRKDLHSLLRTQEFPQNLGRCDTVYKYAESMAAMEHCVAVVSDLQSDFSTIYCGGFADVLGLTGYSHEGSIWESEILNRMSEAEREAKFIAELRLYNHLRRIPRQRRSQHYLLTQLRCNTPGEATLMCSTECITGMTSRWRRCSTASVCMGRHSIRFRQKVWW